MGRRKRNFGLIDRIGWIIPIDKQTAHFYRLHHSNSNSDHPEKECPKYLKDSTSIIKCAYLKTNFINGGKVSWDIYKKYCHANYDDCRVYNEGQKKEKEWESKSFDAQLSKELKYIRARYSPLPDNIRGYRGKRRKN